MNISGKFLIRCGLIILGVFLGIFRPPSAGAETEINSTLMESTFIIAGPNGKGEKTYGTSFVLAYSTSPGSASLYTLITAAHVMEEIRSDAATIILRRKNSDGHWVKVPTQFQIRKDGNPLWIRHPDADVAAMFMEMPDNIMSGTILSANAYLAPDEDLQAIGLHPGDEVYCLGFPVANEANDAGFPILRRGIIASYPILPTKESKRIVIDANIFPGNSGGPVYYDFQYRLIPRGEKSIPSEGHRRQIIGLIIENWNVSETQKGIYGPRTESSSLGLANVVPAAFIRETLQLLARKADYDARH